MGAVATPLTNCYDSGAMFHNDESNLEPTVVDGSTFFSIGENVKRSNNFEKNSSDDRGNTCVFSLETESMQPSSTHTDGVANTSSGKESALTQPKRNRFSPYVRPRGMEQTRDRRKTDIEDPKLLAANSVRNQAETKTLLIEEKREVLKTKEESFKKLAALKVEIYQEHLKILKNINRILENHQSESSVILPPGLLNWPQLPEY